MEAATFRADVLGGIEVLSLLIELLAVAIIVVSIGVATAFFLLRLRPQRSFADAYSEYKARLGRGLLLGLEILVAADVIRTVALEPNFQNVAVLALLVVVRTFLSWSLVVEIESRWPWQQPIQPAGSPPAPGGLRR